jgi:hypothetical protein
MTIAIELGTSNSAAAVGEEGRQRRGVDPERELTAVFLERVAGRDIHLQPGAKASRAGGRRGGLGGASDACAT